VPNIVLQHVHVSYIFTAFFLTRIKHTSFLPHIFSTLFIVQNVHEYELADNSELKWSTWCHLADYSDIGE